MSGKDERKINKYPPDCPICFNCHEWYLGKYTWILTKKSMNKRSLKYSVICLRTRPIISIVSIECVHCKRTYRRNDKIFHDVVQAYRNNRGDLYHLNLDPNGRTSNVWPR